MRSAPFAHPCAAAARTHQPLQRIPAPAAFAHPCAAHAFRAIRTSMCSTESQDQSLRSPGSGWVTASLPSSAAFLATKRRYSRLHSPREKLSSVGQAHRVEGIPESGVCRHVRRRQARRIQGRNHEDNRTSDHRRTPCGARGAHRGHVHRTTHRLAPRGSGSPSAGAAADSRRQHSHAWHALRRRRGLPRSSHARAEARSKRRAAIVSTRSAGNRARTRARCRTNRSDRLARRNVHCRRT